MSKLHELLSFVSTHNGINDKDKLAKLIVGKFGLTKDRKVYYCEDFAIRFSKGARPGFANTVLSLSNLKKVDHIPFLVCVVSALRKIFPDWSKRQITSFQPVTNSLSIRMPRAKSWVLLRVRLGSWHLRTQ
jgi:hypothetical protein